MKLVISNLWRWLVTLVSGRPHFIIGTRDNPYMNRWYLIPRNPWFNIYLHQILRSDDDRALHDHPWLSVSILFWGSYAEQSERGIRLHRAPYLFLRSATYRHRLIVESGKPAWTLFFTGPKWRTWGFWCPKGFVPWHEFVAPGQEGEIGRGCGEQS